MNNSMGGAGMWGMGIGWTLIIVVAVLVIAALWNYLRRK